MRHRVASLGRTFIWFRTSVDRFQRHRQWDDFVGWPRGAGLSLAMLLLATGTSMALHLLLSRTMGVSEYGVYAYALSWLNLLVVVGRWGQEATLTRYVAAYSATGDWPRLRGLLFHSSALVCGASLGVALLASSVVWKFREAIGAAQSATLWWMLAMLPMVALLGCTQAALRSLKRIVAASMPEGVVRQLLIGGLVATLAFPLTGIPSSVGASRVMVCSLVATLFALALSAAYLRRSLPPQLRTAVVRFERPVWNRAAMPLLSISILNLLLGQMDVVLLGLLKDVKSAGIYALASRIASLATFGLLAANMLIAPAIAEFHASSDREALQRFMRRSARGVCGFLVASSLALAVVGRQVLWLFGVEFTVGYLPLLVLLIGHAANSLGGSVGFLLTMTGHERAAASILGIAVLAGLVLHGLLIPRFGMTGAAAATAATTAIWNGAMVTFAWRRLRINPTVF